MAENVYYKYLSPGKEDKRWGLFLTGGGHQIIDKFVEYPPMDDPSHHYFHWSVGRRLGEYQVIYITKGQGIFESEITSSQRIHTGDIFFLFPDVWHRYKPDESTGWQEYWVEFDGELVSHYRIKDFLTPENPVIKAGIQEDIAKNYLQIIDLIKEEKPGFQYIASGILMQILGQVFALKKYHPFEGKTVETQINQAKLMIMENMSLSISPEETAKNVGMGYSLYRKKFREYTGVSPTQYQIQLRINRAKDLLIASDQSFKEIAHNLGFETTDYFARLFKKKTGFTPSDFRVKNRR